MSSMKTSKKRMIAPSLMLLSIAACGSVMVMDKALAEEPAPAAAGEPAPPTPPVLMPPMSGPLAVNSKPNTYDAGLLGNVYVTGIVSGFAQWQSNVVPGDRSHQA